MKYLRLMILSTVMASTLWVTGCAQQPMKSDKQRVVFQVSDADAKKWNLALNNAKNVQTDIGKEKMDLLRAQVAALQLREHENTARSIEQRQFNFDLSRAMMALVTLVNVALLVVAFRRLRADRAEEQHRQARLDRLVAERTSQLEVLASHLQQVSEDEKSRIARELHDQLGAILTASKMDISWVRQHLTADQPILIEKLTRALKNLDQGVQVKRRIIEDLVPSTLRTFGLTVALGELAENMQASAGWALNLDLPEQFIFGVAFNTNTWGYSPLGVGGPYESLNVGLANVNGAGVPPSVGVDLDPDVVYWNTVHAGWYSDGGVGGFGILRPDTGWLNYQPAVRFTTFSVPSLTRDCKNGAWENLVRANFSPFKNQGECVAYVNTGK